MNEKDLQYLVIGCSSGIGLATAKRLIASGHHVFGVSRNAPEENIGQHFYHLPFDVLEEDYNALAEFLPPALDGLVYCPGTITLKPFSRLSRQDFLNDYEINVVAAARCMQAALPALKKGAPASVVLFSTVAAAVGMNFHASIAAAKAGVEGLALSVAAEFASLEIRVNVIAPSITQTPLAQNLLSTDDKIKASANRHPIKKIGDPDKLAAAAAYLLSNDAGWVTGQVFAVDGGLSSLRPL